MANNSNVPNTTLVNNQNNTTQGNNFNGVNQLVKTDGTGKLPAIDGSLLTNLPSGSGGGETILITTNYTATNNNLIDYTILANSATPITISLADISITDKIEKRIKNIGTGLLTIDPFSSQTIDENTTVSLTNLESLSITSYGGSWYIV